MSSRKRRRRHFRDSKFKYFLGEHAPRLPQFWGAFGALTFPPLRAALKSPATLLTADYRYLIAYEINAQGWKKRLGLDGIGGGGCIFKIAIYCQEGVQLSVVIIFGGKVLIHHTFLKTPVPLRDVINDRSLGFFERW